MAVSLAEIIILCLVADWLFKAFKMPGLIGMLAVGAVLGPAALNAIDPSLMKIGADLRSIALIVILLRAGLELSLSTLRRVGGRALLLAFVPAAFEAAAVTVLGPVFLGLSRLESLMLGCVLGAVSPAVVVPMMVRFNQERLGTAKGIPTLMLAGASLDDVSVIVAFSVTLSVYTGASANLVWRAVSIPLGIVAGVLAGLIAGAILYRLFSKLNPRATKRALAVLAVAIVLSQLEHWLEARQLPFAALLSVMAMGFIFLEKSEPMAHELSAKFGKIWVFAEIILFSMVGAQVDFKVAAQSGLAGAGLILLSLLARSVGTWLCTLGSNLNAGERLFVVISYLPKATVQAAIGSAPLAAMVAFGMPTTPGNIILAVAVLSIVMTAPLGALAIAWAGRRFLSRDSDPFPDALAALTDSAADKDDEEL